MYIDLGAEEIIGAEREGRKIAVEIKSFPGDSAISEFHTALGQYLNYLLALEEQEPERSLYLAVPLDTYIDFFSTEFARAAVRRHQLKLLVYNLAQEAIIRWEN
jgi:hypothetical protein